MRSYRPPTLPPQLWQPVSTRTFSSTSAYELAVRNGTSRSGPATFDWKRPFKHFPRPTIKLISDETAANTYLESLTSKRLTIEADIGRRVQPGTWMSKETSYSDGIMSITDAEGVLILHLAQMKRAPEMLVSILTDPTIEKQKFGVLGLLKKISTRETEFFNGAQPVNFVDLRSIAASLHPRLEKVDDRVVHSEFMVHYARDALGMRAEIQTSLKGDYSVQRLSADTIDELANTAWLTHVAGFLLRSRLETKIAQALEKDIPEISRTRGVPRPNNEEKQVLIRILTEKSLTSHTWGASDLKRIEETRGGVEVV